MMAGFDPDVFGTSSSDSRPGYDASVFTSAVEPPKVQLAPKKGTGNDIIDGGNAVGTGYFRGLTRLAGLPVDTVANVIDLGKAGIGSAYQAITGKPAPDALQIGDRSQVVGSGDYLVKKLGATKAGNLMVNPANPDYEGGYLQNAGAGLTAVARPQTVLQAANQAILGVGGATSGKATMDATGSPALAIAASMGPTAAQQALVASTRAGVVGANPFSRSDVDAKTAAMRQRSQDLKNAGVESPTLGLASGNQVIGGVENILQSTPGAVGVMRRAREGAINGLQGKTQEAADLASTNRGALESGTAIQGGINKFRDDFKARQEQLYGRLDAHIPPLTPTGVPNTLDTLSQLNADIPGAPNVGKFFKNGKLLSLEDAMRADTAGAPASVFVHPQPPKAGGGIMNSPVEQPPILLTIPESPPRNALPWEAVKKTRTMVGREIADNTPFSDVPRSKWDPLYGALSQDMGEAARLAGPDAQRAFGRATDYTRAGVGRLDRVAPFANAVAPEQAYTALVNASKENVSTLQAVKKTLPQDARGTIAGTVIERLGKATNGVQNESGTNWSSETFLTNWNKMTPRAREELFSGFPNSSEVKANVDAVAKATSMMRDSSKLWANPSGTGANSAARATLAGVGIGSGASALGMLNPAIPLAIGGGLLGANVLARGLTSPTVVNAMARRGYMSPELLGAQLNTLVAPGLLGTGQ